MPPNEEPKKEPEPTKLELCLDSALFRSSKVILYATDKDGKQYEIYLDPSGNETKLREVAEEAETEYEWEQ